MMPTDIANASDISYHAYLRALVLSRASQRNTISHGGGGEVVKYVVIRGQPVSE